MDTQGTAQPRPQPMDAKLRLLLVEDSVSDAELAVRRLRQAGYDCSYRRVVTEDEMRAALRAELPDLILSDFTLPQFDGMSALAVARAEAQGVSFIFLSGSIGEERAIAALQRGATDYVLKSNPTRLVPAVKRALEEAQLRHARRSSRPGPPGAGRAPAVRTGASARVSDRDGGRVRAEVFSSADVPSGGQTTVIKRVLERRVQTPSMRDEATTATVAVLLRALPPPRTLVLVEDAQLRHRTARRITPDLLDCEYAADEQRALQHYGAGFCPVVITDSLELIHKLRLGWAARAPFILYVAGLDGAAACDAGLLAGADESVAGEANDREFNARLRAARRVAELEAALRVTLAENRKLSAIDDLTHLASRRFFGKHFPREVARSARYGHGLSLILCDIDHFKKVNDTFGHTSGDQLLRQFGRRLQQGLRRHVDWVARIGGEEFAIVLPETAYEAALHVALKLQACVADSPFKAESHSLRITASFGLCGIDKMPAGERRLAQRVFKAADAALYRSKNEGRNRVTAGLLRKGERRAVERCLNTDRNPVQKPTGRPVSDDRGNATWEWNVGTELDSAKLKALTDGMAVEESPSRGGRTASAGLDPYNKRVGAASPLPEPDSKRRTLDDMRRLSDEIRRRRKQEQG